MTAKDIYTAAADAPGTCPDCATPYTEGEPIIWAEHDGWSYDGTRWVYACRHCAPDKFKQTTNGVGNEIKHLLGH